jgi:hypothetical protein
MEGTEKPHVDKYKDITNDRNYVSCMLTSLLVSDLENCFFVAQSVLMVSFKHILNSFNTSLGKPNSIYNISLLSHTVFTQI